MPVTSDSEAYPVAQFRKTYFEECAELMDALQSNLELLANGQEDDETLHAIFRSVHSVKGGAGAFGCTDLVAFSHTFESLLDALRDHKIPATHEIKQLLLRASDALADIVNAARLEQQLPPNFAADISAAMRDTLQGAGQSADVSSAPATADAKTLTEQTYRIRFRPHTEMLRKANEPLLLIRQLGKLGSLRTEVDSSSLPPLDSLDPEAAYLNWTFTLDTAVPRSAIQDVFEFVEDDCDLEIESSEPARLPAETATSDATGASDTSGTVAATVAAVGAAQSIRVDVDKVDRLVNLVGELVISQAMLTEQGLGLPADKYPELIQGIEALAQSARELQESVMAIRAQPVKSVFARMPRIVRELAATLGKEVRIVTSGEMTEIDKTVIEQLNDPLTHMIRNALDHGIESPVERIAAGKVRQGTIHLSAAQRSGRIVIEVSDDGRGINKEKILAKAKARGLVPAGANLTDDEINELIFLPAFSTAEVVSNISGRGVGMDVVKRNVQALGGRISVRSRFGQGSAFTLSLPLTLAVVDGMVVSVGRETFIIPLVAIVENLRPQTADIHPVVGRGHVLALRGEYLPLVYLHRLFSISDAIGDPCRGIVIIVQSESAGRVGIVVDELLGQQQVVVKSLEANYEPVDGISGATILGNGRVALILDVARLHEIDVRGTAMRLPPPDAPTPTEKDMTHAA
ncbi:chemotaxis protein CheA [Bradyrhizobium sp. STM 3809]|uniref:chemotaxis protein CheA n=1 Tax=Bradyrhizobium sp. STM 3809 TaxID=551936 RepID=UPI0002409C52|nr:chemotaxis protein CheA [Bradyrhizobium sp. STM 3809]CCD97516.1 Chemotaxis protein cheA [Bradyrhizobium sp. STM 3809]